MKKLLASICFLLFFFANSIFACSLIGKSLPDFDKAEYIFIGEVIGYTHAIESAKLGGSTYGLVVKVKESVYLPKTPKTHFEIFPLQLLASCSSGGTQIDNLKEEFPVNSEIRVIAKEAEILPNNLSDGNIRLEERPGEIGSIALNLDENKNRMTSIDSIFDYKSYKFDMNKDSVSKYLLPEFEIRKDLLRLTNTANHKERTVILERLLWVPASINLDVHSVLKKFTLTEVEYNSYFEPYLKRTAPELYEAHKIYHGTISELVKLGYTRDAAKKALDQAIIEGTKISKQELLKKSLKILRKDKYNYKL